MPYRHLTTVLENGLREEIQLRRCVPKSTITEKPLTKIIPAAIQIINMIRFSVKLSSRN